MGYQAAGRAYDQRASGLIRLLIAAAGLWGNPVAALDASYLDTFHKTPIHPAPFGIAPEDAPESKNGTVRLSSPPEPDIAPDFDGLRRDTYYFLGYQFVILGALYVMPERVSGWSGEQKQQHTLKEWRDNARKPTWDDDKFYLNYILHPYWGGTYYVRAQERGYDHRQSFWYAAPFVTDRMPLGTDFAGDHATLKDPGYTVGVRLQIRW